jgi:PQ loop repeat
MLKYLYNINLTNYMIWQDILISIVSISIAFSVVPQIYHNYKTKTAGVVLTTSLVSFIGAYLIATAFITLNLYFSFAVTIFNGILWMILFVQKLKYK